jgi:predicted transcriptional regulator
MSKKRFINSRLAEFGSRVGISVADLAERSGLSQKTIYRIQSGDARYATKTYRKVLFALNQLRAQRNQELLKLEHLFPGRP